MSVRGLALIAACLFVCTPLCATLLLPSNVTAEATGPSGAVVGFDAAVAGAGEGDDGRSTQTVTCSPASLSLFPLGTTIVSCVGSEGSTGSFPVTVVDTTAPLLSLPASFTVVTSVPAAVTYNASASDLVDGTVPIVCTPASGAIFPLGTTTVSCTASDTRGNTRSGSFTVALGTAPPPPPNPLDVTAEATGPDGAVVFYSLGSADPEGRAALSCTPAPGSTFPLGVTNVQCATTTFKITVVDTTAPLLTLPGTLYLSAPSAAGAVGTYTTSAIDLVDGSVVPVCTPLSGSTFALGTTTVSCSATDAAGNAATGDFDVVVLDVDPPQILAIAVSPATIWPPNLKLVDVTITAVVTDNVDTAPLVRIVSITSNETLKPGDAVITGLLTAKLRADRDAHGSGRTYTITVEAVDAAGNRSTATVTVKVPHDQAAKKS